MIKHLLLLAFIFVLGCQQQEVDFSPMHPEEEIEVKVESEPIETEASGGWEVFSNPVDLQEAIMESSLKNLSLIEAAELQEILKVSGAQNLPPDFYYANYKSELLPSEKIDYCPRILELSVGHLPIKWIIRKGKLVTDWQQDESTLYLPLMTLEEFDLLVIYETADETVR